SSGVRLRRWRLVDEALDKARAARVLGKLSPVKYQQKVTEASGIAYRAGLTEVVIGQDETSQELLRLQRGRGDAVAAALAGDGREAAVVEAARLAWLGGVSAKTGAVGGMPTPQEEQAEASTSAATTQPVQVADGRSEGEFSEELERRLNRPRESATLPALA